MRAELEAEGGRLLPSAPVRAAEAATASPHLSVFVSLFVARGGGVREAVRGGGFCARCNEQPPMPWGGSCLQAPRVSFPVTPLHPRHTRRLGQTTPGGGMWYCLPPLPPSRLPVCPTSVGGLLPGQQPPHPPITSRPPRWHWPPPRTTVCLLRRRDDACSQPPPHCLAASNVQPIVASRRGETKNKRSVQSEAMHPTGRLAGRGRGQAGQATRQQGQHGRCRPPLTRSDHPVDHS